MHSQGRTLRCWGPGHRGPNAARSGCFGVSRSTAAHKSEREAAEAGEEAEGVREAADTAVWPLSLLGMPRRPPGVATDDGDVLTFAHFREI